MQNRLCFHMRKTTSLQDCERIGLAALFPGLQVIPGWAFGVLVVDLSSIARESDCEIGSKFFPYEQSEFRQQILQRGVIPLRAFEGLRVCERLRVAQNNGFCPQNYLRVLCG